ncbi:MAG: hypothetical protein JWM88_1306 [Verrucomicrobia bacterium]|nr:hypothetical protein [Verrucomicrobiota bacterium]
MRNKNTGQRHSVIEKLSGEPHTLFAAGESRAVSMMSSKPTPKLPLWIFFLTDAVLLLTAWLIASRSQGTLSSTAIFSIVACVITGAIVGTVPLILHYEQVKNETLDDRQRALEALASTLTTAAEQIGIAAQGLHAIAELSQKNLRHAEQLPKTLQEKLAEFQSQLSSAHDEERDEMKRELAALRAVDSERLASTAERVQKTTAELGKLDASTQKSLAAAQSALAKAPEAIAASAEAALAAIEARLAARAASAVAAIEAAEGKRARRPRTDEPAVVDSPAADQRGSGESPVSASKSGFAPGVGTHIQPIVPPTSAPFTGHIISVPSAPAESPPSSTAPETVANAEPVVVPVTTDKPLSAVDPAVLADSGAPFPPSDSGEPKVQKKRPPRKPKTVETAGPALDLGIAETPVAVTEFTQAAADEFTAPATEPAISSDGATRLLVTAYIGIGNRLFIRGDGPGLAWDKGVPLQFVSIGKWRWETADATSPVKFKLFKNDETECAALGTQSLESGRQQEVTASF